ncbi:MAG: adenine phosphoribosyltransferase [Armatimonadia bacterium]|nr:adenine phosphoribosyltransferase [Armatimonadia bacterium]
MADEILAIKQAIRDVPDFPVEGVLFKDITPVLKDPKLLNLMVEALTEYAEDKEAEVIAGIESRGFIMGAPVAVELDLPFVPVRKAGKLPWETVKAAYELEYGTAEIEIHRDAFDEGDRVVVIDDLLATGGTARATFELIEKMGGVVAGCGFIVELTFLGGPEKLEGYDYTSFVRYGAGE